MNTIKFYSSKGKWGPFSNFSRHSVSIDGRLWQTTEHYYQAMKTTIDEEFNQIHGASSPREARDLGQKVTLRPGWEQLKNLFMLNALVNKTLQCPEIGKLLASTGDAEIVEDSPVDYYWGCGADGTGQNKLGKLWMLVRSFLKEKEANG